MNAQRIIDTLLGRQIVLIGKDGRETARLPRPSHDRPEPWISHGGKRYGFGVAKTDGTVFYYEV